MVLHAMSDADERKALTEELWEYGIRIAQPDDPPLFTKEPAPVMQPMHWRKSDLDRLLAMIGERLKLERGGQRRTLRLANPGLPFGTTPTFWCSIQYINPHEVADAHRHAATALRFIMEGAGVDTIVDGEQYVMHEGDLILTPSWTWHDHENKGDKPMIWLDVLDVSLVRSLHAVFFQPGTAERQDLARYSDASFRRFGSGLMRPFDAEPKPGVSPVLVYGREMAEQALERAGALPPDPFDDTLLEYQNPMTGGPALPTIGTALQRLRQGFDGQAHRHTGSVVYHVLRGTGRTRVADQVFDWGPGDFMAVPPWAVHAHSNTGAEAATLFQVNDIPVMKALGFWRVEAV